MNLMYQLYIIVLDLAQVGIVFSEIFKIPFLKNKKQIVFIIVSILIIRISIFFVTSNYAVNINSSFFLGGIAIMLIFIEKPIKKLCMYITIYMITSGIDLLSYHGINVVADKIGFELKPLIMSTAMGELLGLCFILIVISITNRFANNKNRLNVPTYLFAILSFGIISLELLVCGSLLYLSEDFQEIKGYRVMYFIAFCSTVVLGYFLMVVYSSREEYKLREKINDEQMEQIQEYYQQLMKKDIELRQFKHDYINHIMGLHILLYKKKYDELGLYLNEIDSNYITNHRSIDVGNDLANAILNNFIRITKEKSIDFEIKGNFPETVYITNFDICAILTNAIENAITASLQCNQIEKTISIKIKNMENKIIFEIKNPVADKVEIIEGCIKTTKEDNRNHGFGIQNMRRSTKKYHGLINYEWNKETMQLITEIMLRNEVPDIL